MKLNLIAAAITLLSASSAFAYTEVVTPEDMVNCIQAYVVNSLVSPGTPSWENFPSYDPALKVFSASWHSDSQPTNGSLVLTAADEKTLLCDYERLPDGAVDQSKPGYCRSLADNSTEIKASYSYLDYSGKKIDEKVTVGTTMSGRIYCY